MDGSGYPWGLKAAQLDPAARILAVADIYDALTTDRPYRAGMSHEQAFGIMRADRGTKLCEEALDVCEDVRKID